MKIFRTVSTYTPHTIMVRPEQAGQRLDVVLTQEFSGQSRSQLQQYIAQGLVTISGAPILKAGYAVLTGQTIILQIPHIDFKACQEVISQQARDLSITVIFEHHDFLVLHKSAGITVHKPGHEQTEPTLADWLIAHYPNLVDVGQQDRPGIVHRLDKHTSGLILIPRTVSAHATFGDMFKNRTITKEYTAIVQGHPPRTDSIDLPITRHPVDRVKMTARAGMGRESVTKYEVQQYFKEHALVHVFPQTGRTHQIRVHMAAIGHPLAGDSLYGGSSRLIDRQALHARRLQFIYHDQPFDISCPLPPDMQALIDILSNH